jgi:branched-chain amino acid aminotransferase
MLVAHFKKGGWSELQMVDAHHFQLSPAAKVLHYGQEIFEGMKVYRHASGPALFRPDRNIARMSRSAEIMVMPPFPENVFLDGLKVLSQELVDFIPAEPGSLYLRPTMIATTPTLGVSPATEYLFYVLATPAESYFGHKDFSNPTQLKVLITEKYSRAVRGGTGAAKAGGNYAASLRALQESKKQGFDNVLFLDAVEKKYLEELAAMNILMVENGTIVTPPLGDTVLAGVTRESLLALARLEGLTVREEPITIDRLIHGVQTAQITEVFGCGTAVIVASITEFGWREKQYRVFEGKAVPVASRLYKSLTDIHFGRKNGPAGWIC